jgi:hypothetical protein
MASATFIDQSSRLVKSIETILYPKATANRVIYPVISLEELLPFKIKFTNIGIQGYDSKNPPPIGIAVIGINNYIL